MKVIDIIVTDKDGKEHEGKLIACPKCEMEMFTVFILVGQEHPHIQCATCHGVYCYQGQCP